MIPAVRLPFGEGCRIIPLVGEGDSRGVAAAGVWVRLPVFLFLPLLTVLALVGGHQAYEPRYLLPSLNAIFLTATSLLVSGLAARTFLADGSRAHVFTSGATLIMGAAGVVSATLVVHGRLNLAVAVFNVSALLSGLGHLLAATNLVLPQQSSPLRRRWPILIALFCGAVLVVVALTSFGDVLPAFVSPEGSTLYRWTFMGVAIAEFGLSGILVLISAAQSRSEYLEWYGLGLMLHAMGLLSVILAPVVGDSMTWLGRTGQYLGACYLLVAVTIALRRGSGWLVPVEHLREVHGRYARLVELLPEPLVVHTDGVIVFANRAALAMAGASSTADLVGRCVLDLVPPEDLPRVEELLRLGRTPTGARILAEARVTRLDGTPLDVSAAWVDVEFDGRPSMMVVLRDITIRKRAEDEMREARRLAEEANAAKDRFLATLSHELRTPLNPISMATRVLQEQPGLGAEARRCVELIRRNVDLEARLIDDLLDLTRATHGKMRLSKGPVDLHDVVRAAAEVCRAAMDEKGQRLELRLESRRTALEGDAARLQQVFWNILLNAVKFTPHGGRIEVQSSETEDGRVEVKVRDSGIGIAPERIPGLFKAFEQERPGQDGGLGLGLAISRTLTELHGGTLEVSSEGRGHGTTVLVRLPAELSEPGPARHGGNGKREPAGRRILLVEDHADTAEMLQLILESQGHTIVHAATVAQALQAGTEQQFDILLCDLGLPDGTGYEVVAGLSPRPALSAALTGYGMPEDRERCLAAGFSAHLTKPVDMTRLEELLRNGHPPR